MLSSRLRQLGYTNSQFSRRRINFCARLRRQLIPYVHHDRGTRDSYVTIKAHHLWRFLNKKNEFRALAQRYADRWFSSPANVVTVARQTTPYSPPIGTTNLNNLPPASIVDYDDDEFELPRLNLRSRSSEANQFSAELDRQPSLHTIDSPSLLSSFIEDISSESEHESNNATSIEQRRNSWDSILNEARNALTTHNENLFSESTLIVSPTYTEPDNFSPSLQRTECIVCLESVATHGFMHANNIIHLGVCESCVGELLWYCRSCTKHVNTELGRKCRRHNHIVEKPKCVLCNCRFDNVVSYNMTTYFM